MEERRGEMMGGRAAGRERGGRRRREEDVGHGRVKRETGKEAGPTYQLILPIIKY